MSSKCCASRSALLAVCVAFSPAAVAAGFAAGIAPSKFELAAKPGQVSRDTVRIVNPTGETADYLFRTSDWRLNAASGVEFREDILLDDSCRPWVRLERKTVRLAAGAEKNYRFEVHVPADAERGLCRFAILIEPSEAYRAKVGDGSLSIPIVGRYAVIVYVTIGDAAADIELVGFGSAEQRGRLLPTLKLANRGDAHARASGRVTVTDRLGRQLGMVPSTFPVLPGRTEEIQLAPEQRDERDVRLTYPLTVSGRIEIGEQAFRLDERYVESPAPAANQRK